MGHVLGMVHEQTRHDRDDYVEYRCDKIKGYKNTQYDALMQDAISYADSAARLCEDKAFAQKYGFNGSAYTKNDDYGNNGQLPDDGQFDVSSIMIYPSNAFAEGGCQGTIFNLDDCVLVALVRINGNVVNKAFIPTNVFPSDGDVAFVKRYYA